MTQMIRQFVVTVQGNEEDVKAVIETEIESALQNSVVFAGFDGGVTASLDKEAVKHGDLWISNF